MIDTIKYGRGYIEDTLDLNDYMYKQDLLNDNLKSIDTNNLPEIDLRDEFMPKIYNQFQYGSCMLQGLVCCYEYQMNRVLRIQFPTNKFSVSNAYSKKFAYYMTRYLQDNVKDDTGANPRSGCQALLKYGLTFEKDYAENLPVDVEPSFYSLAESDNNKINAYYRLTTLEEIVDALLRKIPVPIGTDIDLFRDSDINGLSKNILNVNKKGNPDHCVVIVGIKKNVNYFGQIKDCFIIRNSWGETFSNYGYCFAPIDIMMEYNIFDVMIIIRDTYYLDVENEDYLIGRKYQEIPNNSLIINKNVFDLDYANSIENVDEITNMVVNSDGKIYVKTINGEIFDNVTGLLLTVEKIISSIGNRIKYKDKNGNESIIYIK